MTTTLLAHEFRRTRGFLGVVAGACILFVLVGTGIMLTMSVPLGALLSVGTLAGAPVIVLLGLAVDYWRSAYGRGGYLTHALPVRGSAIYRARLLYGTLVVFAGVVLTLGLAVLPFWAFAAGVAPPGVSAWTHLGSLMAPIGQALSITTWIVLVAGVVGMALAYLVQYYFAASIGSEGRLAALGPGGPILVWFALYLITQVLTFVSIAAVPLGLTVNDGVLHLVGVDYLAAMTSGADPTAMPFGMILLFVALTLALAWRTARSWDRRVTLR